MTKPTQVKMDKVIEVCEQCKLPADRAWKSYKDKSYGFLWAEACVCRKCWSSFITHADKQDKIEEAALSYREAF